MTEKKKKEKEVVKEVIVKDKKDKVEEVKETKKEKPEKEVEALEVSEPIIVTEKNPMTRVIPMVDMNNVYIGGKYYKFKKNVEQRVPVDVERVLRERDLIK